MRKVALSPAPPVGEEPRYGEWVLAALDQLANATHLDDTNQQIDDALTAALADYLTIVAAAAGYQPLDSDLTSISGLSTTTYGRALLTLADAAALTALLNLASETLRGALEKATDAEIRSAATGALAVCAEDLESAAAGVALSDAATVAVDWDTGINFTLTVTASRIIGNPTNGQPGTWRTILVQGNDATDRVITFDTQFLGEVPTITDCDSGRWYLLMIYCVAASHFVVSSKRAKGT